jgi:hypothetical protein
MRNGADRETMTGLLKEFDKRITYLERRGGGGGGGGGGSGGSINEVWIGSTPPDDPNVELWFDPGATMHGADPATDETTDVEGP